MRHRSTVARDPVLVEQEMPRLRREWIISALEHGIDLKARWWRIARNRYRNDSDLSEAQNDDTMQKRVAGRDCDDVAALEAAGRRAARHIVHLRNQPRVADDVDALRTQRRSFRLVVGLEQNRLDDVHARDRRPEQRRIE